MTDLNLIARDLRNFHIDTGGGHAPSSLKEAADILESAAKLPDGALWKRLGRIEGFLDRGAFLSVPDEIAALKAEFIAFAVAVVAKGAS